MQIHNATLTVILPSKQSVHVINSLLPSDARWHHRSWSTLAQVMPYGTKALPEPMLTNHQ